MISVQQEQHVTGRALVQLLSGQRDVKLIASCADAAKRLRLLRLAEGPKPF